MFELPLKNKKNYFLFLIIFCLFSLILISCSQAIRPSLVPSSSSSQQETPLVNSLSEIRTSSLGITNPFLRVPLSPLVLQQVGHNFLDPDFNTTLKRMGDAEPGTFFRHEYSQLQAFNSDATLVLLYTRGGDEQSVLNVTTLQKIYTLNFEGNSIRWNPARFDELIHFDSNDIGSGNVRVVLQKTNIRTGITTDIHTFPKEYQTVAASLSQEELSRDGKWITMFLRRTDGGADFLAYDLVNQRLGAVLKQSENFGGRCSGPANFNWVAPSPLGNYLIIQWNQDGLGNCNGVEVFDIQTGKYLGKIASHRQHSDLGLDEFGNEIYVTAYFGNNLFITTTKLPGSLTFLSPETSYHNIILSPGWYHMDHISCKGPKGICVIDAGFRDKPGDEAFSGEVYLVYTSGSASDNLQNSAARVRRLAHTRSESCDYWDQPQATMSVNGNYVLFASNWGTCAGGSDSYLLDLRNTDLSAPLPLGENSLQPTVSVGQDSSQENQQVNVRPILVSLPLGAHGLPVSTYTLNETDVFTLNLMSQNDAQQWYQPPFNLGRNFVRLVIYNGVGDQNCTSPLFTSLRFYVSETGNNYSLVAPENLLYEPSGCLKQNQIYTLLAEKNIRLVTCVSNLIGTQNYCTVPLQITLNSQGVVYSQP